MKFIFNLVTTLALRFRWLTLLAGFLLLVLGAVAVSQMNQELLPPIEFPQTIILAQASGMTSEQVLTVFTQRIEPEFDKIDEIINLESQSTGAFGALITAYNDFGIDQQALQGKLQDALDSVWLPLRHIQPASGEPTQAFAVDLLNDLTPDVLIYLSENNPNFFFQLSPDVWQSFSDETVQTVLSYLASQVETFTVDKTALELLVDKELIPQLNTLDDVARVSTEGGQALPGANDALAQVITATSSQSLLLRLSPEVWAVVSAKAGNLGALDTQAVETLRQTEVEIPTEPPALPESWQMDHFVNASDLLEITTLTAPLSTVFNDFYASGQMVGALGQTDDLTTETVTQLLEIDPTLVDYLKAEQLVAMSPEVFAVLPDEYIAGLDGFTRDALAAASLAQSITGEEAVRVPVELPDPWRIQPPQLITFSFADLPLAVFSVSSTGAIDTESIESGDSTEEITTDATSEQPDTTIQEIPEGPALPPIYAAVGVAFGVELNTADDLIVISLPEEFAQTAGVESLTAAQFLSFLAAPPEGVAGPSIPVNPALLISGLTPEVVGFIAENDPTFLPNLAPEVFNLFTDEVLALPQVAPPLDDAWNVLASQPQFSDQPLETAGDILAIGDGSASTVLNTINATVPAEFEGYEVRLFNSLTPVVVRYFLLNESDFYEKLDSSVLLKFSAEVLASLPEDVVASLDNDVASQVTAIASGEEDSAFAALQALYTTNIPEADADAPALNPAWSAIAPFYGIEMDTADDFFRFPEGFLYEDASAFINSIFGSAQGANFARNNRMMEDLPVEAVQYILARDASVLNNLNAEALQLMSPEVLALLPQALQDRAVAGGEVFVPERAITRTNGQPSLFLTVYKDSDANTVSTYKDVEKLLDRIDEENEDIAVNVIFEQSSFVEDSINGVAREGGLGAVFAVIVILVFLSAGRWQMSSRRRAGVAMFLLFGVLLALLVASGLDAADGNWSTAFQQSDVVFRVLLIFGLVSSLVVMLWPGDLPDPAWRATIVIAVSIPLSIMTAFALMNWFAPNIYKLLQPLSEDSAFFAFILRLFPEKLTLNIMTLSGLTVAVGRVVDDSIVVLENIFRQIQAGGDKKAAVLAGTRDVSSAIFTATIIAVIVFLPLGVTGGIIGAFFLPFGLAVTYALIGSFVVAITVIPATTYLMINTADVPQDEDIWLARYYVPVLRWGLSTWTKRLFVLFLAFVSMVFGFYLFSQRPFAFLPNFGEPQVSVAVELPASTGILETNEKVSQLELFIQDTIPAEAITAMQTSVGGGGSGFEALFASSGVAENQASITIGLAGSSTELLDTWTQTIRTEANAIFGEGNVTVSAASVADSGFGGFALVIAGPVEELERLDPEVIKTLNSIEGITNVTSNLSAAASDNGNGPITYIRINRESAISYAAELETENTIGITQEAIQAVKAMPDLPDTVTVSQGFQSETQTKGFLSLFTAMGIALVIMIIVLIFTFNSIVYWLALILSIVVAPVGAAIALTLADRVLGISALIGLLMLLGLVISNAVVLIDRVRSNRTERGMPLNDALVEAGGRRLRPILMTSLTTIIGLIPLAIGLSDGAIIASELGTVVIGGALSSTILTLLVVPVAYRVFYPVHRFTLRLIGIKID